MSPRHDFALTIVSGVITAAFLALAAWIYSTGNRVTALEIQQPNTQKMLELIRDEQKGMHEDIRQIRDWVVPDKQ